jgi:HSP20 family molecular chaperone IbpA
VPKHRNESGPLPCFKENAPMELFRNPPQGDGPAPGGRERPAPAAPRGRQPCFEVEETDEEVVIRVAAPGFEPGEFTIRRAGNVLAIRAEHLLGQVRLAVPLPPDLGQPETVEMAYHDGELVLRLPRKPQAQGSPARAS